MSKRSVPLVILTLALCSFPSLSKDEHTFACNGQSFDLSSFKNQSSILSPDRTKRIQLKDYEYAVFVHGKQVKALEYLDTNCCIEIGWSPDSSQFFITYSDSATYHQYKTHLFSIAGEQVSENRAPQTVFDDFGSQHSCPSRGGGNNLFLLGWTKDSQSVFLVSEVIPAGDCGNEGGVYGGYLVNGRDGTIVHRYGQRQTDRIEKSCRAAGILRANTLK